MRFFFSIFLLLSALASGCASGLGGAGKGRPIAGRNAAAAPAVFELQAARFSEAVAAADKIIADDAGNPQAHLVRAIARYRVAAQDLTSGIITLGAGVVAGSFIGGGGGGSTRLIHFVMQDAERRFAEVDADLAIAAQAPEVSLDLCLACWRVDWNRDGEINSRDEDLLQIEIDEQGEELPADDSRRRPTFRFDVADVHWARAMISFQRSVLDLILAYDIGSAVSNVRVLQRDDNRLLRIPILDKERIAAMKARLQDGLDAALASYKAASAETDDEREWLPNPRQKNHPMPLVVDEALYATWQGVLSDLRALVDGREGLSVSELAQLGDHTWAKPPVGYLNVGALLDHPADLILDLDAVEDIMNRHGHQDAQSSAQAQDIENALKALLGEGYAPKMVGSKLPSRLMRMRGEVERGQESIERKLRYLLWLN